MDREQDKNVIMIDLIGLSKYLLRRCWIILISAAAGGIIFFAVSRYVITPVYQSSSMLYLLSKATSITSFAEIQIGDAMATDMIVIATSKPVLDGARKTIAEEYGRELSRSDIADMITVINRNDTRILEISAESEDAELASIVANAVREETAQQMAFIMKTDSPTTIEQAEVSLVPVSPNLRTNTAAGSFLFFVVSAMLLSVLYIMNDNIKTEADIEKYLKLRTLVIIPDDCDIEVSTSGKNN